MAVDLELDDILEIDDLPLTQVYVKQWSGNVYVRTMRGDERSEVEAIAVKKDFGKDPFAFRCELLRRTVCTKDGALMINTPDAAKSFAAKNAEAVETVFEKACEVNGFRQKDVEVLAKN